MSDDNNLKRWTVADKIPIAVVLGTVAINGLGWQAGAIGGGLEQPAAAMTAAGPADDCGEACGCISFGISGDPATGMPYAF